MASTIRLNFEIAVRDYVRELLKRFDWDAVYGYWVADDCTGVYACGDYFINLADVIYIVDNNVKFEEFDEWYSYCLWAHENGQTTPNLSSWVKGCPRASKSQMERIDNVKQALADLYSELKENERKEQEWTTMLATK